MRSLFNPNIVEKVLKIPVCLGEQSDKLIWGEDRSGEFSVKFAYRWPRVNKRLALGEPSNALVHEDLWKSLWRLKIQHSVVNKVL